MHTKERLLLKEKEEVFREHVHCERGHLSMITALPWEEGFRESPTLRGWYVHK